MQFNKNWTKEDNDVLRQMNIDKKSEKEIIEFFGKEKLLYHPKKKFHKSKSIHTRFNNFINEIKIEPKLTEFTYKNLASLNYPTKKDIFVNFSINNHDYVIILFYLYENNIKSYELLFTTKEQYAEYEKTMNDILNLPGNHFTDNEHEILKEILEKKTKYDELYDLLQSISYILIELYNDLKEIHGNIIFSITETKIKLYKNIIKDSFPSFNYFTKTIKIRNVEEIIYYYND